LLRSTTVITVLLSVALHVGLATGLVAVAKKRDLRRRAISVAVTEEKKKPKDKPKPPPPPKPIARPAPVKVAAITKEAPAPSSAPKAAAAPVAMNLSMSNAGLDIGPGIGLQGRAAPSAAPAPLKVASAISERRTNRTKEETGAADAPCEEEPTKPEPVVKTALDYSLYPQAQADGLEGKIKARVTVAASGEVTNVEIVAGIDPAFDAAIQAALMRWRFKPALACGKPVAGGTYVVQARFELAN
jgi:TonB family protein